MAVYLARRLMGAALILLGVSAVTFLLLYVLPADPARQIAGRTANAATVANIRTQLGLDLPVWEQYGRYLWSLVKVEIRALAQANVIAAGGNAEESTMIWSGGMGWIADCPDPSNFYGPILGCAGAIPGGWNWSWFCDESIDKAAVEADSMADPAKAKERALMWRVIFDRIQDQAPWIPLFNENRFVVHSKRLKATDAVFVDPTWLINYQNLEVSE